MGVHGLGKMSWRQQSQASFFERWHRLLQTLLVLPVWYLLDELDGPGLILCAGCGL